MKIYKTKLQKSRLGDKFLECMYLRARMLF